MCRHVKMSGCATPATQNDITTCFETFSIFAASAIDTATAPESQRLETRHVVASKRTFRVRLRQIFTLRAPKLTFSHEFCYGPTSKGTFRARLPSIFITCQKMPCLPRNWHLVTTSRSADNTIRKKHTTRHV